MVKLSLVKNEHFSQLSGSDSADEFQSPPQAAKKSKKRLSMSESAPGCGKSRFYTLMEYGTEGGCHLTILKQKTILR